MFQRKILFPFKVMAGWIYPAVGAADNLCFNALVEVFTL
jgi:hypothetical protein